MTNRYQILKRGEIRGRPTTAQDALNSTGFTCHRLHQSFNSGLCTMLLSMPAGYKIPPHWHGNVEHVTVISG